MAGWVFGFTVILSATVCQNLCVGIERVYYIACSEETWDYAPGGNDKTVLSGYNQESSASVFLNQTSTRIGHMYKKVIYKEYTDYTFSIQKPKPEWLGFVGPILEAETGDTLIVHFKNRARRNYSIHAHGVAYNKSHEGAVYNDGADHGDRVAPGGRHTYYWNVTQASGPSAGDPDCMTWLYHSHVSPVEDISSGLVGLLLSCRRGALARLKGARQYALYVSVVDENLSWYLDDNIATYINDIIDKNDKDFRESNKMHAINGYVYGHLPGLSACVGETIHWHMASLGTDVDIHSIDVSGHSFKQFSHRRDSVRLTVSESVTAQMTAMTRGKWMVTCQVNSHRAAGMEAFLTIDNCNNTQRPDINIRNTRRYYIAAEETTWDYAPSGRNKYDGGSLTEEGSDSEVFFKRDSTHIGGVYKKALFQEYTNFLFRDKKVRGPEEEHLGFLGPVIKAEVGDLVKIVFYNKASRNFSIHPHGVQMSKLDEGALYNDGNNAKHDDFVQPDSIHTYYWTIPEDMGPTPEDPPCLTRMYTSAVDVIKDSASGLVGPLLICKRGSLDNNDHQINVTKEFFLLLSVTDENKSWYLSDNINITGVDSHIDTDDNEFVQSNLMHGINGRLYGNLDGLDLCEAGVVMWHVFSIGTESDIHTVTFHGNSFLNAGQRSTSGLLPGTMRTFTMVPRHKGSWGLTCGSPRHLLSGSKVIYNVTPCGGTPMPTTSLPAGKIVRKYIKAVEMDWNYVPRNLDGINNRTFSPQQYFYVGKSSSRIGGTYKKVLYEEYTDGSFTVKSLRPQYLGYLGPLIRLEVGDTLEIVLKNAAIRNYSIKAEGLIDTGITEPNPEHYNTKVKAVKPGYTFTYRWNVTESSGPGPDLDGPECRTRVYYSDVNAIKDVHSGLVGPLIICRRGALKEELGKRVRRNVQKDFAAFFTVTDENKSWYLEDNVNKVDGDPTSVNINDYNFTESNLMRSINGYLFGNQPLPDMNEGETVDWYLVAMGASVHAIHFHGNDVEYFEERQHTKDVVHLFPAMQTTVRMRALNYGKWMYYCHVNDHYAGGMQAMYEVYENSLFHKFSS